MINIIMPHDRGYIAVHSYATDLQIAGPSIEVCAGISNLQHWSVNHLATDSETQILIRNTFHTDGRQLSAAEQG